MSGEYARAVGERLRAVRAQQHLSLRQAEEKSGGRHSAVVIGSYERGDRSLGAARLAELAALYAVPVSALLPPAGTETRPAGARRLVLDLEVLDLCPPDGQFGPVRAFADAVRRWRGDWAGQVLSVRSGDEPLLALMCMTDQAELVELLVAHGLAVTGPRFDDLMASKAGGAFPAAARHPLAAAVTPS